MTEARLLDEGGLTLPEPGEIGRSVEQTAVLYASLVDTSYTVRQAAAVLGLTEGRVRQRLLARTLFGTKEQGAWRLPAFQFYDNRPLPGLDIVLKRLPADLHLLEVYGWFTAPNPDLVVGRGDDEEPLSPRDRLLAGRPAEQVAAMASDL